MFANLKNLYILLIFICMTSCKIDKSLKTIQIEIMKPVDFTIPENVKTVAIFNRDSGNHSGNLYNFGVDNFMGDTTLNNTGLSNYCVNGLADFLNQEAYFPKVENYLDSLNNSQNDPNLMVNNSVLFKITKADALIFLDLIQLENGAGSFFDGTFRTRAALSWTISFNNETRSIISDYVDTIFFSKSQYRDILQKNQQSQQIYQDISRYLGKSFGKKIIPSWIPVERMYYHSKNSEMIQAEKFARNQDWLAAAEIWQKQTKNKNQDIAAKASYNMALACEMDGKYDLAMDWLIESRNFHIKDKFQHQAFCHEYIRVLALRKNEIAELEKQIRN